MIIEQGISDTDFQNAMIVRTKGITQDVVFVVVQQGKEVELNVTQMLKNIGWQPVVKPE
jgi:hypothetical protein